MTTDATMDAPSLGLPWGRPLIYDDLASMPEDGHRYELIDGVLIVSPAARPAHQRMAQEVFLLLREHCPPDLEVFVASPDIVLSDDTVVLPDVLVVRRSDVAERNITAAPLLVVEVQSPSTRRVDTTLKRARYEAAGVASYWLLDADAPAATVLELADGAYHQVAHVGGDDGVDLDLPYPLRLCPAELQG